MICQIDTPGSFKSGGKGVVSSPDTPKKSKSDSKLLIAFHRTYNPHGPVHRRHDLWFTAAE